MLEKLKNRFSKTLSTGLLALALSTPANCCAKDTKSLTESTKEKYEIVNSTPENSQYLKNQEKPSRKEQIKKVPILMYHDINQPENSEYSQRYSVTPDMFRRQLQLMYDKNYVPISLEDYLENDFSSVPDNKKPYIITFDDATAGQFKYILGKEGNLKIDPDSAVAILNEYAKHYQDFEKNAVFFTDFVDKDQYFKVPFAQKGLEKKKINYLQQEGYNIQCHTTLHPFLGERSQKTLYNNTRLYNYLVDSNPEYETLAYPYGDVPQNPKKLKFIKENFDFAFGAFANRYGSKAHTVDSPKFVRYNIPRIEINNNLKNLKKYVLN